MAAVPRPARSGDVIRRRGHLRLIQGGATRKKKARGSPGAAFAVFCFLVVGGLIFSLVFLNIMAAKSSFRMEELREQVSTEEARLREMRFRVAEAEAPDKVAEAATELGLVVPQRQEYLMGDPAVEGGSSAVAPSDPLAAVRAGR